jgi:hypothetical protein
MAHEQTKLLQIDEEEITKHSQEYAKRSTVF